MDKDARKSSRGMIALILAIALIATVGVVASITDSRERSGSAVGSAPPGPAPAGKVWSPEHGHWHDAR